MKILLKKTIIVFSFTSMRNQQKLSSLQNIWSGNFFMVSAQFLWINCIFLTCIKFKKQQFLQIELSVFSKHQLPFTMYEKNSLHNIDIEIEVNASNRIMLQKQNSSLLINFSEKKIQRVQSQTTNANTKENIEFYDEYFEIDELELNDLSSHSQIDALSPCSFAPKVSFSEHSEQFIDYNQCDYNFENLQNYEFMNLLGNGSFGEVHRALFIPMGQELAVKIINFKNFQEEYQDQIRALVKSEGEICNKLKNCASIQFLPKTYAVFQHDDCVYIVTEMFHGFTLDNLLQYSGFSLSSQQIQYYLASLLLSIKQIHEKLSSIHRDIKPENIMILADGSVKLIDFGCSKQLGPKIKTSSIIGSYQYFSPERFSENYGREADLWAFAVIAYELTFGKLPFQFQGMMDCDEDEKFMRLSKIVRKREKINLDANSIDKCLKQLIEGICNCNSQQRQQKWTISHIQSLQYFSGIEWNQVKNFKSSPPVTFSLLQIQNIKNGAVI